ncbi:hypothetical protein [uncultured Sanguibacteroides sp.]|uniref:PL29 family lyase N-terminal domain-containing protein n=1 Tax=uncultured Sanguibacteroides sp. TaxID=1635151 RepID=UPI0025D224A3|nr:hypothetical protein [uncultured Sanguibacteroides sp.]
MNKKGNFAKTALLCALLYGLAGPTFVGCKDYDDDIKNLQTQIDANKEALAKIKDLIDKGAVVTKVETDNEGGIFLTLSDGTKHHITKGDKGEDGAEGPQGLPGATGTNGKTPTFSVIDGTLAYQFEGEDPVKIEGATLPNITVDDFVFTYDEEANQLLLNGNPVATLPQGPEGPAGKGVVKFEIIDGHLWCTYTDGEKADLGQVKGNDGTTPEVQNPKFEFSIVDGKLMVKDLNNPQALPVEAGDLSGMFQFGADENGNWTVNGKIVGQIAQSVKLTVVNDVLCLNGVAIDPEIRMNNNIYMIKNANGSITINMPKQENETIVYEQVTLPTVEMMGAALRSIAFIPTKLGDTDVEINTLNTYATIDEMVAASGGEILAGNKNVEMLFQVYPTTFDLTQATLKFNTEAPIARAAGPVFGAPLIEAVAGTPGKFKVTVAVDGLEQNKVYPVSVVVNDEITSSFIKIENAAPLAKADVNIKTIDDEGVVGAVLANTQRKLKYNNTTGISYQLAVVRDADDVLLNNLGFTTGIELAFADPDDPNNAYFELDQANLTVKAKATNTPAEALEKECNVIFYAKNGANYITSSVEIPYILKDKDEDVPPTPGTIPTVFTANLSAQRNLGVATDLTTATGWNSNAIANELVISATTLEGYTYATVAGDGKYTVEIEGATAGVITNADWNVTNVSGVPTITIPGTAAVEDYTITITYQKDANTKVQAKVNLTVTEEASTLQKVPGFWTGNTLNIKGKQSNAGANPQNWDMSFDLTEAMKVTAPQTLTFEVDPGNTYAEIDADGKTLKLKAAAFDAGDLSALQGVQVKAIVKNSADAAIYEEEIVVKYVNPLGNFTTTDGAKFIAYNATGNNTVEITKQLSLKAIDGFELVSSSNGKIDATSPSVFGGTTEIKVFNHGTSTPAINVAVDDANGLLTWTVVDGAVFSEITVDVVVAYNTKYGNRTITIPVTIKPASEVPAP